MSLRWSIILCTCLIAVFAAHAQTTGSIAGIVTDANRAVIPGANVSLTDQAGQVFSVVTNEVGSFRIPALSNGLYTVKMSASGFKAVVVEDVKIDVNTPATLNVVLEVGSLEETVTVTGGTVKRSGQSPRAPPPDRP